MNEDNSNEFGLMNLVCVLDLNISAQQQMVLYLISVYKTVPMLAYV
jgi:hypothetical protein